MADEVLRQGVQGITDLITAPGVINVDFADVKTVMLDRGVAHMGVGKGNGESRVNDAVQAAVNSPLLETTIAGARAILLNISGGYDLSMLEVNDAAAQIGQNADRDAIVILGATINEELHNEIVITVIATGFEDQQREGQPVQPAQPSAPIDADASDPLLDLIEPESAQKADEDAFEKPPGKLGLSDDEIPTFLRPSQ
jgi:cell division protein FtsZ